MLWDATQKAIMFGNHDIKMAHILSRIFVTLGDPAETIHDPAVAPDQSFIVFDSGRVKGGLGSGVLHSVRGTIGQAN